MFDKKEKQLIRLVEVTALIGLMYSFPPAPEASIQALEEKNKCRKRLREIAFPLEIEL
jgi:hypothetical protein